MAALSSLPAGSRQGSLPHRSGMRELSYKIAYSSSQACRGRAENLPRGKRPGWVGTSSSDEMLVLSLGQCAMVNYLEIDSKNIKEITVHTGMKNSKSLFSCVRQRICMPMGRKYKLRLGFLPCCYIQVTLHNTRSTPGSALNSLRVVGMQESNVQLGLGPRLHNLLMHTTEKICYPSRPVVLLTKTAGRAMSSVAPESEADSLVDSDPGFEPRRKIATSSSKNRQQLQQSWLKDRLAIHNAYEAGSSTNFFSTRRV